MIREGLKPYYILSAIQDVISEYGSYFLSVFYIHVETDSNSNLRTNFK